MKKCLMVTAVLFLLMVAAAGPGAAAAGGDPLASPTPQPTERISAPEIIGINPVVVLSEGNQGETHPSDNFFRDAFPLAGLIDLPGYVELNPPSIPGREEGGITLAVPQRSQAVESVNCGPAALGMALDYLVRVGEPPIPSTLELSAFLSARGLMYEWGTGVEELAFAARHFGFPGSYAFQGWTLEKLAAELGRGNPVLLALGENGAGQPGHFVTLTGVGPGGSWVRVNDPLKGEATYSAEEFLTLWGRQNSAGMVPLKNSLNPEADPLLPWMRIFSVLSLFGLMVSSRAASREPRVVAELRKKMAKPRRMGIGGGPMPPEGPVILNEPRYEYQTVYRGLKTIEQEVPVYETRRVKVGIRGIKKKIPLYESKKVQVGFDIVTKQVPVYKTIQVITGTKLVKEEIPVTHYYTKQVLEWKKINQKVPIYLWIGAKRYLDGYKTETRWVKVPVTKRIPFQTTKIITHQEPVYEEKKVISGYRTLTEKVPKYETKQVLVGYQTITESQPVFEEQRIQVGTKTVTRQVPDYQVVKVPILEDGDGDSSSGNDGNQDDLRLFEKQFGKSDKPCSPTGMSEGFWDFLSEGEQQKMVQGEEPPPAEKEDGWGALMLKTFLKNIVNPFLNFKEHPDEVLKGLDPGKLPKLLSLSAAASWDINILSQEGTVLSQSSPSDLGQLFYMEQKLNVETKSVVTVNPGSLIDFKFTSGTGSVKLTENVSYIFGPGEWGYSIKKENSSSPLNYFQTKHLVGLSAKGITYKLIEEKVLIDPNKSTEQFQVKLISTAKCETKTIKLEGILLTALLSILAFEAVLAITGTNLIYQLIPRLADG
jgi:hypothetical protein